MLDSETILDYLGEHSAITGKGGRGKIKCRVEQNEDSASHAGSEDGMGRGPRATGSLEKLENARKHILPWSLQKGAQPCQHFDFSPMRLTGLLTSRTVG